jgi:phage terminase Nu1 subunit (DNA packaging protein)
MPKAGAQGVAWVPPTCSAAELAKLLGVSTRALRDWDIKGVLVRAAVKGRYETLPSLHAYHKSLREQAAGRATTNGRSLADEKAEATRVNREIQQVKLAQLKGEILTMDEVTASWTEFATTVRAGVLSIPGKARSFIPHLTPHDAEELKRICRDTLNDMADEAEAVVIGANAKKLKR